MSRIVVRNAGTHAEDVAGMDSVVQNDAGCGEIGVGTESKGIKDDRSGAFRPNSPAVISHVRLVAKEAT